MAPRFFVNDNGAPFDEVELASMQAALDASSNSDRKIFRNDNAACIAQHQHGRFLVVSGPGTGKSTLFKQKIDAWLTNDPTATVLAVSFVRKLVADLASDIENDTHLSVEQK